MPRGRIRWGIAGLLLLSIGTANAGDRDVAELLHSKGERAYRKRDYEEAEQYFRRALAEYSPFPEAAECRARALLELGRTQEALRSYLLCEMQLEEMSDLDRKQRRLLKSVKRRISKLGKGYAKLEELDREFVRDAVAFSRKYFNSHPEWAKLASTHALAVDPTNRLAQGFLEKLEETESPSESLAGVFEPLVESDALSNWDPGARGDWSCSGGVIKCDVREPKGRTNLVKLRLEGSYELKAAFRVRRTGEEKRSYGFMLAQKPDGTAWGVLVNWNNDLELVKFDRRGSRGYRTKILTGFRPTRWHLLHVRVEPGRLTARIGNELAFTSEEMEDDAFDGVPGLFAQDGAFEIKEVGVKR